MNKPPAAEVTQILLWYDQAEIILIKTGKLEYVLAVSSGHEDDDDGLFVGASMTLSFLADYQAGKYDLRYALSHANLRKYWTFAFDGFETKVALAKVKKSSDIVTSSLPDSGFFSREHHAIDVVKMFTPDTSEVFNIDGSWELGEFSRFYGQIEDLYYIFNDVVRFNDPKTKRDTKEAISEAMDRPWRGGGSYVGFYDKIANDNAPIAKLKVSGIKYNSPGYVEMKAKKKPFDDMISLLKVYSENYKSMRQAHNSLYRFMAANKLLKQASTSYANKATRESIRAHADKLDAFIPESPFVTFIEMADGNEVVAAKVLLSLFRRLDRLYQYFDEGRVKYDGIDTDASDEGEEELAIV